MNRVRACVFACCVSVAASAGANIAGAQHCDERFPWLCQGWIGPPAQSHRLETPPPSDEGAPHVRPTSPFSSRAAAGTIARAIDPALLRQYAALYARMDHEPFPVPAINLSDIHPEYFRKTVVFPTNERPGTIIIDARDHFLYLVQEGGRALRYGVGVGRQGFAWSGVATIGDKQEWPDWYPPKEMLARQPELMRQVRQLQGGLGVPGGVRNPLGARALYLWHNNKDTLYRIHGTVEPWTIGQSVSSGCIRMINQDVMDLYQRIPIGAKVVVRS